MFQGFLRFTTQAQQRVYGPLVYSSDAASFFTTALANTDFNVVKHNAGAAVAKNVTGGGSTYLSQGQHNITFNSTDTSAIGSLRIYTGTSGTLLSSTLPSSQDYHVLTAWVYDAFFANVGALLPVDIQSMASSLPAAINLKNNALAVISTAANSTLAVPTATSVYTDLTNGTDNFYQSRSFVFITGALAGQGGTILTYTGATKLITCAAMTGAPIHGDVLVIT